MTKKPERTTKVLLQLGLDVLKQSSAVHIQSLVSADGILLVISSKHHHLFINLTSVPGRQLVNSPTAAILERYMPYKLQQLSSETEATRTNGNKP